MEETKRSEHEIPGLSAHEIDILKIYFGLGREKASFEEIQLKYNLTPQRAEYIKDIAFRKLCKSEEKLTKVRAILSGCSDNIGQK